MKLNAAYKKVRPSVVSISRLVKIDDEHMNIIPIGTGVCIDKDGYIATAYHVIKKLEADDPEDLKVVFTESNKNIATGLITEPLKIAKSVEDDIAVLKVSNMNDGKKIEFSTIKLPTQESVGVGTEIATIGFPLRNELFTTALPDLYRGIISRIDYNDRAADYDYKNIMLDINLNVGNSGGPVFDTSTGELIGIVLACHRATNDVIDYDNDEIMVASHEYIRDTSMINCMPWFRIKPYYDALKAACVE